MTQRTPIVFRHNLTVQKMHTGIKRAAIQRGPRHKERARASVWSREPHYPPPRTLRLVEAMPIPGGTRITVATCLERDAELRSLQDEAGVKMPWRAADASSKLGGGLPHNMSRESCIGVLQKRKNTASKTRWNEGRPYQQYIVSLMPIKQFFPASHPTFL